MAALHHWRYLTLFACCLAAIAPAALRDGGCVDHEAVGFIQHYLDPSRGAMSKMFDPSRTELGLYQVRPISHAIDAADAHVYAAIVRAWDVSPFVPASAMIASALLVAILFGGARRTLPNLNPWLVALLAGCLISSPQFLSTYSVFYRSAKPVLAVILLALLFFVRGVDKRRSHAGAERAVEKLLSRESVVMTVSIIAAGLLDPQGAFYGVAALVLLAWHYRSTGRLPDLAVATGIGCFLVILYIVAVDPALTWFFSGDWPDIAAPLRTDNGFGVGTAWLAVQVVVENLGVLLGGFEQLGWVVAAFALAAIMIIVRSSSDGRSVGYAVYALGAHIPMFVLILNGVPAAFGHRFWYYPAPLIVIVVFIGAVALNRVWPALSTRGHVAVVGLFCVVIGANLTQRGRHTAVESGAEACEQTRLVRAALRDPAMEGHLDETHRSFLRLHRQLRRGN